MAELAELDLLEEDDEVEESGVRLGLSARVGEYSILPLALARSCFSFWVRW